MRIKTGNTYLDGEGREWLITHFNIHGAVGSCAHRVQWRDRPFVSYRLFQENGRPVAGIGRHATLVSIVQPAMAVAA